MHVHGVPKCGKITFNLFSKKNLLMDEFSIMVWLTGNEGKKQCSSLTVGRNTNDEGASAVWRILAYPEIVDLNPSVVLTHLASFPRVDMKEAMTAVTQKVCGCLSFIRSRRFKFLKWKFCFV